MVTIRDIAKAVGVSSGTVSRVLNYDSTLSISPNKRQAILATAEALNYATPRARAAKPRRSVLNVSAVAGGAHYAASPIVGNFAGLRMAMLHFMTPEEEFADPYYIGIRLGIERRCCAYEADMTKLFGLETVAGAATLNDMSGVVMVGKHAKATISWMLQACSNAVLADTKTEAFGGEGALDCVYSDLELAMSQLLDELTMRGYVRIGFAGIHDRVDGPDKLYSEGRCKAFVAWLEGREVFDPALVALATLDHSLGKDMYLVAGYEQTMRLLAQDVRPDAIVTMNDTMAIGAYKALHEAQLEIGEEIAVVSFNDIPLAQFMSPALSSMKIASEAIGEASVDLLMERLNGRKYAKRVNIPTEMIWRESCPNRA